MAVRTNLVVERGSDFTVTLTITDQNGNTINLSGYSGFAQIRKAYTSINASATFTVNVVSNSSANLNQIILTLPAVSSLNIKDGRYVYDVIVQAPSTNLITRIIEGIVTIRPGVTVLNTSFFPANVIFVDATSNISANIVGPVFPSPGALPDSANNSEG